VALIETPLSPKSADADLLIRLRARRPGAFEELLEAYQQPIYRFVYRLLDDPSEAPDVTQEVFIKVFCKIDNFRGDCSLKTWLYRIAANEAANRRRWFFRHRRPETCIDAAADSENGHHDSFVDQSEGPFDLTYQRERAQMIEETLRRVDKRFRLAVILRDIEELSYNEIAEVMQVSLGTVKSRILRGREALKTGLLSEFPAEAAETYAVQAE